MFTLNYTTNKSEVQIKFADLTAAFIAARSLDPLKANGTVANIFVGDEEGDGVYMVPPMKYLINA